MFDTFFKTCLPLLLVALVTLGCASAQGATYYVSANSGYDLNSGLSATAPWKTVARVNAAALKPGDQVLFKSGEAWRETLSPPSSGLATAPIVFGSFNGSVKPLITGSDAITSWSSDLIQTNVWNATVTVQPKVVWFNGVKGVKATSKSGLSLPNSWYWSANVLSVNTAGTPSGVEAANRSQALLVDTKDYLVVNGLELCRTNDVTVKLRNSNHSTVESCSIHDSPIQAIYSNIGGGNHTVDHCEIYNTGIYNTVGGNGSGIQWLNTTIGTQTVTNNYFHDIGGVPLDHGVYNEGGTCIFRYNHVKNSTGTGFKDGIGGALVQYNVFENCQQAAVLVALASNTKVYNNTIYHCGTYPGGASPYYGLWFAGNGSQSGVEWKNNIIDGSGIALGVIGSSTGLTSDYNLIYLVGGIRVGSTPQTDCANLTTWRSATAQDAHSLSADPKLVLPDSGDFRLQSSSPGIGAGTNVGLGQDFSGAALPAKGSVDIGALQFIRLAAPATPTVN